MGNVEINRVIPKGALAIPNIKMEIEKAIQGQGYQNLRRFFRKRRCPVCGEESLYFNNPNTLTWIICRRCKYEFYLVVPYYWLLFILSFVMLFPMVIALGLLGIAISLVLFTYAMIDYHFIFSNKMNNSLNQAILRKLEKQNLAPNVPVITNYKGRI
jgi:hypothetical protein